MSYRQTRQRSATLKNFDKTIEDDIENINLNKMRISTRSRRKRQANSIQLKQDDSTSSSEQEDKILNSKGTPPKQGKFHRDLKTTPRCLLENLSANDSNEKITKKTRNKYQNARQILNSAETVNLPGREKEYEELSKFLTNILATTTSASMYISGPPGTGKTASLSKLLDSSEFASKFQKVYVNCTSIPSIGAIYKKICDELHLKNSSKTEKECLIAIEDYFRIKHEKMLLLVLDEIDQLMGKKQSVLYTIFEWPAKFKSQLVLIGIANALDLTDRMLSRLQFRCELKPKLMHFGPYTKQQIFTIFKSRLEDAGALDIFPAGTIQLLAGKVAAVSGDVRRALDIGRRVVEIAEQQKRNQPDIKEINFGELGIDLLKKDDEEHQPVQMKQVMSVLNSVYGASQTLNDDIDDVFPLQQKILLCSLVLMLKKDKNKDITIGRLHEVYRRVCSKRNILAVDQAEFCGMCSLVEARGILRVQKKKEPRLNKICLQWDEEEVCAVLRDKQLMASIVDDVSCLFTNK